MCVANEKNSSDACRKENERAGKLAGKARKRAEGGMGQAAELPLPKKKREAVFKNEETF